MSGHPPPADPWRACRTMGEWPFDMLRVSVDTTRQAKSVRLPSQKRRTTNPKATDYQEGRGMPGEGRVPHRSYGVASSPDGLFSDKWNTLATSAGFRRYDGFRAGIPPKRERCRYAQKRPWPSGLRRLEPGLTGAGHGPVPDCCRVLEQRRRPVCSGTRANIPCWT